MSIDEFKNLIDSGREIEFVFNNRKFSITYGLIDDEEVISFCEFYKETTEVKTFDELLKVKRYGVSVKEMIKKINENEIWIF